METMVKVFLTKEILHQSPRSPMLAWKKSNQKLFDLFNCNNQATVKKLLNITDKYQEIYVTQSDWSVRPVPRFSKIPISFCLCLQNNVMGIFFVQTH